MSIGVYNIFKAYGSQLAVRDITFEVGIGEIVGFIGPNGAGKSTTMKIISGFLTPDSGKVFIKDINVLEDPLSVKKIIGYLPEHNPLYNDLYVKEYLSYVAGLYHIDRNTAKGRIRDIIETTGLADESGKKIGNLSKGYRQRVGLAQALIHDPAVLILDEPTSGLDPNQIIEIRQLISRIGKEKTILLSTHIMQEVEAICDRVIIINNGEIIANDKAEQLSGKHRHKIQTILIETDRPISDQTWKQIPDIEISREVTGNRYLLQSGSTSDIRPSIFNLAVDQGFTILSMTLREKSLEELFKELTKS